MSDAQPASDARRCPLCGEPNACALAGGGGEPCWCAGATIPKATLERLPEDSRGTACVCARCAAAPSAQPPP
jgi:hypothetical protein